MTEGLSERFWYYLIIILLFKISLVAGVEWIWEGQEWKLEDHQVVSGIQIPQWVGLGRGVLFCSTIPMAWPEMTNWMLDYI